MLLLQAFIASLAFKTFLKNVYHLRDHHTEPGYEDEKKITFWYKQIWLFTSSHLGLSDSKQFVAKLLKQKIAEYQNWICSAQTLLIETNIFLCFLLGFHANRFSFEDTKHLFRVTHWWGLLHCLLNCKEVRSVVPKILNLLN